MYLSHCNYIETKMIPTIFIMIILITSTIPLGMICCAVLVMEDMVEPPGMGVMDTTGVDRAIPGYVVAMSEAMVVALPVSNVCIAVDALVVVTML